jgi:hypothetical protein
MSTHKDLIPPPPVLREKLAQHAREGRLLRALLRLSESAAELRHRQPSETFQESAQLREASVC